MNNYPTDIQSVSKSTQPHKFFERYLNNNLSVLASELQDRYEKIEKAKVVGVTPVGANEAWKQSNSVSTMKWRQYNVFQFHSTGIYNLYKAVKDMTIEACDYYGIDFEKEKFMLQGWFNITHTGKGKLDWHDHGGPFAPHFHGYYCVNAEPSITNYKLYNDNNRLVENVNKNNRLIVSEMGHPHAMGDWGWDGPRITIAYDIEPVKYLIENDLTIEQHWIPLI